MSHKRKVRRVLERSDSRLRQRDYLLRIGQAMTAQLDLNAVLSLVIEYAVEMVAGTYGLIALLDDQTLQLHNVASYNLPKSSWPAFEPLLEVLGDTSTTADVSAAMVRMVAETLDLPM